MKKLFLTTSLLFSSVLFNQIAFASNETGMKEKNQELAAITIQYISFYYLQDIYCKKKATKEDETFQDLKKQYEKAYDKATRKEQKMIDDFLPKIFNHLDEQYKDKEPPKSSRQCKAMYEKLESTYLKLKEQK